MYKTVIPIMELITNKNKGWVWPFPTKEWFDACNVFRIM